MFLSSFLLTPAAKIPAAAAAHKLDFPAAATGEKLAPADHTYHLVFSSQMSVFSSEGVEEQRSCIAHIFE